MSRTKILSTAAILLLASTVDATRASEGLDRRISVDVVDAGVVEVLTSFGGVLDAEVELSPYVRGKVTLRVERVTVRTVLDATCQSVGCLWELTESDGTRTLVFERAPTPTAELPEVTRDRLAEEVNMSLLEAPATDLFKSLAGILEAELVVECESADRPVSIELESVPLSEAIDALCRQAGCVCLVEPGRLTVR